ncbi:MAG: DUF91 domain-containing protein, partial [Cyanobacteria bacterium HKST-UBA06]|nr:DUF91 domain-containing protein [Cyanobacteria bacterium HKST-UBA06]
KKDPTALELIDKLQPNIRVVYDDLNTYAQALGDDVQYKPTYYYIAYKRIRNFMCVHVYPQKGQIICNLNLEPTPNRIIDEFSRDVTDIGHWGTGSLELTLTCSEDLERAKPFIEAAYEGR